MSIETFLIFCLIGNLEEESDHDKNNSVLQHATNCKEKLKKMVLILFFTKTFAAHLSKETNNEMISYVGVQTVKSIRLSSLKHLNTEF